jgi:hypothetical protein
LEKIKEKAKRVECRKFKDKICCGRKRTFTEAKQSGILAGI